MRFLLVVILCFVTSSAPAADEPALRQGRAMSEVFLRGDLTEFWSALTPEMQQLFGSVDGLTDFRRTLSDDFGDESEVVDESVESLNGAGTYVRRSRWSQSEADLVMRLGISASGAVGSFVVQPQPVLASSRFLDYQTRTPLRLPFEGQWFVVWGGRSLEQNYHAADRAQRFAIDLLIYRDRVTHRGEPQRLESYYCWDEPIVAPAAGTVARVVADLPDNPIGSTDTQSPAGNHVVLDFGNGEFAFLGHMREDSIRLRPGDEVAVGEELGRCGNSGNTSEPHLHFHLQTTPDLRNGEGLPAFFSNYFADGEMVERAEPQAGQFIQPQQSSKGE